MVIDVSNILPKTQKHFSPLCVLSIDAKTGLTAMKHIKH